MGGGQGPGVWGRDLGIWVPDQVSRPLTPPPPPIFTPQFLEEGGVGYVVSGAGNFVEESQHHSGAVPPGSLRFFFGAPASPGGFAHLRLDAHAATVTYLEATGRVLYRVALPPRDL